MRIEFVDHDLWKIFWTAPSGENVYTFALGYTPDDALECWLESFSLYAAPEIFEGEFSTVDMFRVHKDPLPAPIPATLMKGA
jgi:hypothetical protein